MNNDYLAISQQMNSHSMEEIAAHLNAIEPSADISALDLDISLPMQSAAETLANIDFSTDISSVLLFASIALASTATWFVFQKFRKKEDYMSA